MPKWRMPCNAKTEDTPRTARVLGALQGNSISKPPANIPLTIVNPRMFLSSNRANARTTPMWAEHFFPARWRQRKKPVLRRHFVELNRTTLKKHYLIFVRIQFSKFYWILRVHPPIRITLEVHPLDVLLSLQHRLQHRAWPTWTNLPPHLQVLTTVGRHSSPYVPPHCVTRVERLWTKKCCAKVVPRGGLVFTEHL